MEAPPKFDRMEPTAQAVRLSAGQRLILASASPRRQAFLRALGLSFQVQPAAMDEQRLSGETPAEMVVRLAEAKARVVAAQQPADAPPALILTADTTVAIGDRELGKPADEAEAVAMLRMLRRQPHQVHSAVHLLQTGTGTGHTRVCSTRVRMRSYTDAEIAAYAATRDPLDKAGAYAIQHRLFAPVQTLDGCAAAVMGLPLADLVALLQGCGVKVEIPLAPLCRRLTGFPCCQAAAPGAASLYATLHLPDAPD